MTPALTLRHAATVDAPALAALINRAYEVEAPFVEGPRVTDDDLRSLLAGGRTFLIAAARGTTVGCVMTRVQRGCGYMGLLSVDPAHQRQGVGDWLLRHVEGLVRSSGSTCLDILVINLRHELLRYYEARGFRASGTEPYIDDRPQRQPFHFVRMTKTLEPD